MCPLALLDSPLGVPPLCYDCSSPSWCKFRLCLVFNISAISANLFMHLWHQGVLGTDQVNDTGLHNCNRPTGVSLDLVSGKDQK